MSAPNTPVLIATPESPWLGLRSFNEAAHGYFFGRRAELEDLYERIIDKPLTILFGQSGLGKSSLLQAALTPRLRERGFLPVVIRLDHQSEAAPPETQMLESLCTTLASAGWESQAEMLSSAIREGTAQPGWDPAALLWIIFHDPQFGFLPARGASPDSCPRPVFIIDQFEEIFTLGERTPRRMVSQTFREALAALVENRAPASLRARLEDDEELIERIVYQARPARVLISLREDFLHVLERWRRSMPSLMENRFELRMLSGQQAFEAVVRPGRLRENASPIIPDEVGEAIVRFVAGAEPDVPLPEIDAVPPLLSLVCAELNSQRLTSGQAQITRSQFEGHSGEILQSFYRRSFEVSSYGTALDGIPDATSALSALQRLIEDRLLSPDGFRESIAFDTVARDLARVTAPETAKLVLEEVIERRLLTVEERGGVRRLELAHDVLAPIVKASRDERQEKEALANARREQERAQAEAAAALAQRNRLSRLVALSLGLAAVAVIAAGGAWLNLRKAKQATEREKQATAQAMEATRKAELALTKEAEAKEIAEAGFESAFEGLTGIYDNYAANTIENTPGISERLAGRLKSRLRSHLLEQFTKLNAEQPDHRGTADYIARLFMDEGREAISDKRYSEASEILAKADVWARKHPLDSVKAAELVADVMLEQTRALWNSGDMAQTKTLADKNLAELSPMIKQWPESWRLPYIAVRLENVALSEGTSPDYRVRMKGLAAKLDALIKQAGGHFDLVYWRFIIATNGFRQPNSFTRSVADYTEAREAVSMFREHVAQGKDHTLAQLDYAASGLQFVLSDLRNHFAEPNDKITRDARHDLLAELEAALTPLEIRLPNNLNAYEARGTLLNMQELAVKDGANTRSADELKSAAEKHRLVAARLSSTTSLTDILGAAFKEYTADNAPPEAKKAALATVAGALRLFSFLDITGSDSVLSDTNITSAEEKLRAAKVSDPMLDLHTKMILSHVTLYQQASRDVRIAFMNSFAGRTRELLISWFNQKEDDKIISFYQSCYRGLPIVQSSSGDKEAFLRQASITVRALLRKGETAEAKDLLTQSLTLCDTIIKERPWDWYAMDAYGGLCFEVATAMKEAGHLDEVQPLLRRGWTRFAKMYKAQAVVDRVKELPFKGEIPAGLPPEDTSFFAKFATNAPADMKGEGMKRFTIPCDFSGTKYPFHVYILGGPNGLNEFLDQCRWLKEIRGGTVPQEVIDSFTRLWNIAQENKVSFPELCVYALGTAAAEDGKKVEVTQTKDKSPVPSSSTPSTAQPKTNEVAERQTRLQQALDELKTAESDYSASKSASNKAALVRAYSMATDLALHVERWKDLENWANKFIKLDPTNPGAHANLATSLLFQNRYEEALAIYRQHWNDPFDNGNTLGGAIIQDFNLLEKEGIKHPDIAKIRAALPKPPPLLPAVLPPGKEPRVVRLFDGTLKTGGPFWIYLAVKPEKLDELDALQKAGKLAPAMLKDFGEFISSGEGKSPPDAIKTKIAELYKTVAPAPPTSTKSVPK